MKSIRILSSQVADQIAAGEVVERPASVVKELVENALDAGAGQVDVVVENAGRSLIRVQDDGAGISPSELALALTRFATSKISRLEELESLASYGFRGEALASIASVSDFELASQPPGAREGARIHSRFGAKPQVEPWAGPAGTKVQVRKLFGNTPARLKFLKSDPTERHHVSRTVTALALGAPGSGITLTLEGKILIDTRGRPGLKARTAYLLGWGDEAPVLELTPGSGPIQVEGWVGRPETARADRGGQFFLVNGRWIQSLGLSIAFKEGYGPALSHDRHPAGVLSLRLPPGDMDVNVHPAKREVRFRREAEVKEAVREALGRALSGSRAPLVGTVEAQEPRPLWGEPWSSPEAASRIEAVMKSLSPQAPAVPEAAAPRRDLPGPQARFLGQVGGLYLLVEDGEDLLILDPHAAHERVLYERFMERRKKSKPPSQLVLMTESLDFSPEYEPVLDAAASGLEALGFELVRSGPLTLSVRAVPPEGTARSPGSLVRDLVEGYVRQSGAGPLEERLKKMVSTAACRMAVMDNDRLEPQEVEALLRDLAKVQGAYTCPHGRPAALRISRSELDRRFLRS